MNGVKVCTIARLYPVAPAVLYDAWISTDEIRRGMTGRIDAPLGITVPLLEPSPEACAVKMYWDWEGASFCQRRALPPVLHNFERMVLGKPTLQTMSAEFRAVEQGCELKVVHIFGSALSRTLYPQVQATMPRALDRLSRSLDAVAA